ncbi:MAG: hypothetical protein ACXW6V_12315 [Candidatus Binatia bacterium]
MARLVVYGSKRLIFPSALVYISLLQVMRRFVMPAKAGIQVRFWFEFK